MAPERRRPNDHVTHAELRAILEPILERHRQGEPAFKLWLSLVPLGVEELIPGILRNERARLILAGVAEGRWKRWGQASLVLGVLYVAITLVGSTIAIARTAGWIH